MIKINPSEITPEHVYLSRRKFIATAVGIGALVTSSLVLSAYGVLSPALSEVEGLSKGWTECDRILFDQSLDSL